MTVYLVGTSVLIATLIGLPIGIASGLSTARLERSCSR